MIKKNPYPAKIDNFSLPDPRPFQRHLKLEYEWLEKVKTTDKDNPSNVTWSAQHAEKKRTTEFEVTINSLLPLLRDQAHSVVTIKHAMDEINEATAFVNPGQIPVIAVTSPYFL